jgi:hypothetical protein
MENNTLFVNSSKKKKKKTPERLSIGFLDVD